MLLNEPTAKSRVKVKQFCMERLNFSEWSGYLMSRHKIGIPLRTHLVEQLKLLEEGLLVIDLEDVEDISNSVAEEIGPIFFQQFIEYRLEHAEVFVVYINAVNEVIRGFQAAFQMAQGQADPDPVALAYGSGSMEYRLLGKLPEALQAVLAVIVESSTEVTSGALEAAGIKAPSRKLSELVGDYPWLVKKEQRLLGSGSWAYSYSSIFPSV